MKKLLPWILAISTGILGFLGYVGYDLFYLDWFFLVPLLWAARNANPGRAFFLGWVAGTVGHAGGFYWFVYMLTVFAGLNYPLAIAGLVVFAIYNGLVFAIFTWGVCRFRDQLGWSVWWTAPCIWTALEHVFPFVFPNYIGASQYPLLPIIQIADVAGILGVSFLLIWCNATIYVGVESFFSDRKFPLKKVSVFSIAILIVAAYGAMRISQIDAAVAAAPKIHTAMIQAGKGESAKFRYPDRFIQLHQKLSKMAVSAASIDLVIWPESVVVNPLPRPLKRLPRKLFGDLEKPLLLGTLTVARKDKKARKYSSALWVDANRKKIGLYDKRILVPFGEYLPLGDTFPFLYKWLPSARHFYPGIVSKPIPFKGYRFSLNICYEDLFSGFIRQSMTANIGSDDVLPHALINLTNDSWYGDTVQPLEHLVLASFRAIEHRRALVRATNTGISAVVDPVGRLDNRTGQWTQEILVGDVPMMTGRTFYSYAGNWFGWVILILTLVGMGLSYLHPKKHRGRPTH